MNLILGLETQQKTGAIEWRTIAAYQREDVAYAVLHALQYTYPTDRFDIQRLGIDVEHAPMRANTQEWLGTVLEATRDHSRSRL